MRHHDCDALASELVRQNYLFVALFSVIVWDCLITFRQEVRYVWCCPSRMTKYIFLFCRYCTVGYFIVCSIFGIQWTLPTPTSSKDCATWYLIHTGSSSLIYMGSQLILIREVFNLYGGSIRLATGLFAMHCFQVTGTFILSQRISSSLNFNPICNGRNVPHIAMSILVSLMCTQCITWALILRKVLKARAIFPNWRRYLPTSEANVKMSLGICFVAILLNASHSFASHRVAPIYVFTFPTTMLAVGACRYILRVEKNKDRRSKLAEAIDTDADRVAVELEVPSTGLDTLSMQNRNRHRHSYIPRSSAEMPSRLSDPEALSIQTSESQAGGHNPNTVVSNFPYLNGAQSYKLKENRTSMGTTFTADSPRRSSDDASRHTVSIRTSRSRGSGSGFGSRPYPQYEYDSRAAESVHSETPRETHSVSSIEIGSLHSSSSVNSEELRRFYNHMWSTGPFMASGP